MVIIVYRSCFSKYVQVHLETESGDGIEADSQTLSYFQRYEAVPRWKTHNILLSFIFVLAIFFPRMVEGPLERASQEAGS